MKDELLSVESENAIDFEFVSMGLHLHPEKLHSHIQSLLEQSRTFPLIILGFGLCGGAISSLRTFDSTIIIPRVHDCIPLLLGSSFRYRELSAVRGSFYLSSGWMSGERSLHSEFERTAEKYGRDKAVRLMKRMFESYQRFIFIRTGREDDLLRRQDAKDLADTFGLGFDVIDGADDYFQRLVNGPWTEPDFMTIPPFGVIKETMFTATLPDTVRNN